MTSIFSHGRLRLYLLKLLEEGPKHGYELMRRLQDRFQGLYAPSAGSVYPRLAKLEAEGLVSRVVEGNRTAYALTGAGRAEVAARADELAAVDRDIAASLADLDRADLDRTAGHPGEPAGRVGSGAPAAGRPARAEVREMLGRLDEFAAQARTAMVRADVSAGQVKAVAATLDATLRTVRDLLR
ncbi:PadR family transcriptional regulator [Hamadaea tsunoensis]|uniref:PadR family transcriptional regulator n=1 Tax=Hamadaea tsunoensis TaxID=53368 RepID=UPI0004070ACD|nr:PadR family transcriptional regulator [Hamadaea tsunoensis]